MLSYCSHYSHKYLDPRIQLVKYDCTRQSSYYTGNDRVQRTCKIHVYTHYYTGNYSVERTWKIHVYTHYYILAISAERTWKINIFTASVDTWRYI